VSGSSVPERRRRPVLLLVALLLFSLLAVPFVEYRTDDTFIFLRFARNLAGGHGLSFNPGEPVYGFTAPLWVFLLAGITAVGLPPLAAAKALAFLFGGAAILGFAVLARRRLPPVVAGLATVAFAANAWLTRWSAAAMETSLTTALVIWGLARHAEEVESDLRHVPARWPLAALIFALAILARPEAVLLLVLVLATDSLGGPGARRRALAGAGVAGLVLVPWLAYCLATFGTLLPQTADAKGRLDPTRLDFDPLFDVARAIAATSAAEMVLIVVAAVSLWSWLARGSARLAWRRHAVALLWLAGLPLVYLVTGFDVLSRYVLPLIPVVVLYGFAALTHWVRGRALRPAAGALLAFVLIQNALVLKLVVYPHTHRFSRGVEDCLGEMGRWAAAHTPPGTTVAIADIGAFGYYSDRRVLDLAGLVSPELTPIVNQHPIDEIAANLLFADRARPEYLVDRHPEPERLAGAMGGTFEPITACRVEGLGVRSPAPITYTLYRLHWDRYDDHAPAPATAP